MTALPTLRQRHRSVAGQTLWAIAVISSVAGAQAQPAQLPRGTPVYLEVVEPISSETAQQGEPLTLRVALDVRSGGVVVIPRGGLATASLQSVSKAGIVGKAGQLVVRPERCIAIDGTTVLLEGEHRVQGAEYYEESVGVAGVLCCLGIFFRGERAVVAEKTVISGFVAVDAIVDVGATDRGVLTRDQ